MADQPRDQPESGDDPPTGSPGTGPPRYLLAVAAAVVGVVGFVAAYAISATTDDDGPSEDQLAVADGLVPVELPLLEPTAVGGFVSPVLPVDESLLADGELSDTPPEGAIPAFPVEEGQPATPDVTVVDEQAPTDAGEEALDLALVPSPSPAIILPGLDPAVTALDVPAVDDIDGSPPRPGPDDSADPATEEGTAGTTISTAITATTGADEDGAVPVDEAPMGAPGVIDPCAGDDPSDECGSGFGGTIIPLSHDGLAVLDVTATPGDRCETQVESVPRDRVLVTVLSTARGEFDVVYRPEDDDGGWLSVTVTSAVDEEPFAEADEDVQTCVLLDRIEGATHYEVIVEARAVADGDPALPWTGRLTLPVDDGRPPVIITPIGSRRLQIQVPAAEAEAVEVWTIPRTSDVTESRCGVLDDLRSDDDPGSFGIGFWRETGSVALPAMGPWDPAINTLRQFDLWFFDEDASDLCVVWYRDLEPTREVVERQSWLLLPPAHPEAQFFATGFVDAAGRGTRLHGGEYDGVIANIESASGRAACSAGIFRAELEADGEQLFCSFEVTPDRSTAVIEMGPIGAPGPAIPPAYRAAIELQSDPCAEADLDACTETYAAGIPGPEVEGERTIMGTFQFEVRYSETPIRSREWVTAPTGTFATPEGERPDFPQLDLGATRVEMDPNNPFRVLLTWQADRPVTAAFASGRSVSGIPCRSNGNPVAIAVGSEAEFESDRGVIPLLVCPGSPYEFTLVLADGDTRYGFTPSPRGDDGPNPEFLWRGGAFRTDTVELAITIDLKTRSAGGIPGGMPDGPFRLPMESEAVRRPIGPDYNQLWDIRYTRVQVGDQSVEPEDPPGRYQCGSAGYHDTSIEEPFVVTAGPEVGFQLNVLMWRFSACGLFGNVPITAGGPWAVWSGGIFRAVPILDLLEADDGWRLQDYRWAWPSLFAACQGQENFIVQDWPDRRSAGEAAEDFRRAVEGVLEGDDVPDDDIPREVGGVAVEAGPCNPSPSYDINMDIRAALAGPASAVDTVEVAGG